MTWLDYFENPLCNSALTLRNSAKLFISCFAKFRKGDAKFRKVCNHT